MKKKKALISFFVICILLLSFVSYAEVELPKATREFYVADYAGLLSEDVENIIVATNLSYEQTEEKPQIVVATVTNLQGLDVVSYGVSLFEKWEIGNSQYDNGVLLLLSLEERKVRIETGYGLEGAITDGKAGEILDSVLPDLSEGNYSEGLLKAFYQIAKEVNEEYGYDDDVIFKSFEGVNIDYDVDSPQPTGIFEINKIFLVLIVMLLLWADNRFLGGFFLHMLLRMMFFGRGGGGGGSFGGGGRSGGGGADRGF